MPGQNSNAVAELAFGMMIQRMRNQYDGSSGRELKGRTLGLIGCGAVGVCMAKVAKGFGMKVLGVDPFLNARQIIQRGAEPAADNADIFKRCDFVSLHIPATKETKGSIGKEFLASMPNGGTLINTARLEVVDEAALIEVLKDRPDLGYLSDVQLADAAAVKNALGEERFRKQVFQTPKKMGAQTEEANVNAGVAAAHQIVGFFDNGDATFQVNRQPGDPNPSIYKSPVGDISMNVAELIGEGRAVNFSAGPCCLPLEVLQTAKDDLLSWHGCGCSVLEMSHRSKEYESIIFQAEKDMRELLSVPANFKILFLQGGATAQFAALPLNLLGSKDAVGSYAVTGQWGEKALAECKKYGKAHAACNTKSSKFTKIPPQSEWDVSADAAYLHYTSNETVNGVEFKDVPKVSGNTLLVCDWSSNFMSKAIDWDKHAMIYAGAQKNIGAAGVTVVIVREDLLGKELAACPTAMSYKTYAKADSMYNTPPCYAIYIMGLYLQYAKKNGGLAHFDELAEKRANLLYGTIDNSDGFYACPVEKDCRSRMNVPFVIKGDDAALTKEFLAEAKALGMTNLAGHRSVGGCRASLYNAMPVEGVAKLANFMDKFRAKRI